MSDVRRLKALIVLTSHDRIGDTERSTRFYFDEMAAPCWALVGAGIGVDIASIKGGGAPIDLRSLGGAEDRPPAAACFYKETSI